MKTDIIRRIVAMLESIDDTDTLHKILELVQHFYIRK